MKFRTGFEDGSVREKFSDEAGFACVGDSMTVQADAREADINFIMERYTKTGQMPPPSRVPRYGDFDGISDFRSALEAVSAAQEAFMSLPAKVRAKFENDPAQFLDFAEDPANLPEMVELGLVSKEVLDAQAAPDVKDKPTGGKPVSPKGDPTPASGSDADPGSERRGSSKASKGGADH